MKSRVFDELGDASRRAILTELRQGPRTVGELVRATGLKQPNVSNHLARLREAGLVNSTKVGRMVKCSLAAPQVDTALNAVDATPVRAEACAMPVQAYADAAIAGDEPTCFELLDGLLANGVDLLTLSCDLFGPAMGVVGERYMSGEIDEGQEHLASAVTERAMARSLHYRPPMASNGFRAILGCSAGNLHSLGLRMVSDTLRSLGWDCRFLGANVPEEAFLDAVWKHRPDLVLVSCGCTESEGACLSLVRQLAAQKPIGGYRVGAGGFCVSRAPERFLEAGADFATGSLRHFAEEVLPELGLPGVQRPSP